MSDDVSVEQHGEHVGVVCLRRPPNNFFDTALLTGIADAYEELDRAGWCRAIVLAAEGRHFCAGLDFGANAGQDIAELYRQALRLFAAPLPVVAAVQGAAIGGGFGLALSADFRVATAASRFSANFARLGFHHGFALTVTLPAVVGRQAAADLLLTGRRIGGEEAFALGLCDRLAARGRPDGRRAAPTPASWPRSGPLAVRAIRATLRLGLVEAARLAMEQECAEQLSLRAPPTSPRASAPPPSAAPRDSPGHERGHRRAAAARAEHGLRMGGPHRARSASSRPSRPPVRRARLLRARGRAGAGEVDELIGGHRPRRAAPGGGAARDGGRPLLHRPGRRDHLHHPPGGALAVLRRFTTSTLLAGVCADLIGPDVRLYWDQAVYKKPGTESPFPWHQDNGYAFVEPQQYLTCWVALTDATEENGCPWVVPRLHRLGTLAHEYSDIGFVCLRDPAEAVPVPAAAGSIVVFSSLTPHSTGPNRTDQVRKAYIVQFAPSGAVVIRPEAPGAGGAGAAGAGAGCRPTTRAASTRCWWVGGPVAS